MYSREELSHIKKDFWIEFSKEFPKKWMLYDTKIKNVSFKFYVDNKMAQVQLDIEPNSEEKRKLYFEKLQSLKTILIDEYLPEAIFTQNYTLPTAKNISRIYVEKLHVSLHDKNSWFEIFDFFYKSMSSFELFFYEYGDYIKDLETNV
ncbi:MAG: DUF4268 domain-containing protein [Flavobacterium sp.]|nr:DUF4268 domain-containing protein [Flavobacterium sp.]